MLTFVVIEVRGLGEDRRLWVIDARSWQNVVNKP
jgi:hypothetical protein